MAGDELDFKHVDITAGADDRTNFANHSDGGFRNDERHTSGRYRCIDGMIVDIVSDTNKPGPTPFDGLLTDWYPHDVPTSCVRTDVIIPPSTEMKVSPVQATSGSVPDGQILQRTPCSDMVADASAKEPQCLTNVVRFTWSSERTITFPLPQPQRKKWEHKSGASKKRRRRSLKKVDRIKTDMRFIEHACCKKKCNEKIPVEDVIKARQTAYVDAANTVDMRSELSRYRQRPYTFNAMHVCLAWLKLAMMLSNNFVYNGSPGGNMPHVRSSPASDSICTWLDRYAQSFEFMPDRNEIHLTVPSRKWVWQTYSMEADATTNAKGEFVYAQVTLQYFLNVWRRLMNHIKLQKYLRFTLCEVCTLIRLRKSETRQLDLLLSYNKVIVAHIDMVRHARMAYSLRQAMAISHPKAYLSLVMDGSTCAAYAIPHLLMKTKDQEGVMRMKVSFVCTIVHGIEKFFHIVPEHVCKDSNLSIELYQQVLLYVEQKNGRLPPYLYLQHDNCWREYKNMLVLAFLVFLVARGIFVEIIMNFLPVGHTHNDADATIAKPSVAARYRECETLEEFVQLIQDSMDVPPQVSIVQSTANVSGFLENNVVPMSGQSDPSGFKIAKVPNDPFGRVGIWSRMKCDGPWSGEPYILLKDDATWDPKHMPRSKFRKTSDLGKMKSQRKPFDYFASLKTGLGVFKKYFKSATRERNCERLYQQYDLMRELLAHPPAFSWPNGGLFASELKEDLVDLTYRRRSADDGHDVLGPQELPPSEPMGPPVNVLRRRGRKAPIQDMAYRRTADGISVGEFVIVRSNDAPGFWVARVIGITRRDEKEAVLPTPEIRVQWWSAANEKSEFGTYTESTHNGRPGYITTLDIKTVMYVFDRLTPVTARIPLCIKKDLLKTYKHLLSKHLPADNVTDEDDGHHDGDDEKERDPDDSDDFTIPDDDAMEPFDYENYFD